MSKSRFSKIDPNVVNEIQINAGIVLKNFDPSAPAEPNASDIIAATTGGITINCVPTFNDFGSDIDNVPNNTKEFKRIDGYDCNMSFTILNMNPETVQLALGAADIVDGKITPRDYIEASDFKDIWYVGDLSDGGLIAVNLKNAMSTSGFALKTTKNGKGTVSVTIGGHTSISDISEVPMDVYVIKGNDEPENEPEPEEPGDESGEDEGL